MLGEADANALDRAQSEVLRMLDLVRQKQRGTAFTERLSQDADTWRTVGTDGHRSWVEQGFTPDGKPYPVSVWLEEGRTLAERAYSGTGDFYNAEAFSTATAEDLADVRTAVRVSAIGGALAVGLALAVAALLPGKKRGPKP